jgi:hypothetical protein
MLLIGCSGEKVAYISGGDEDSIDQITDSDVDLFPGDLDIENHDGDEDFDIGELDLDHTEVAESEETLDSDTDIEQETSDAQESSDNDADVQCISANDCQMPLGCVNGVCTSCLEADQCREGQACIDEVGECGDCRVADECRNGQACLDGNCGACEEAVQCTGQLCVAGICTPCNPDITDDACVDAYDDPDYTCQADGLCSPPTCTAGYQCQLIGRVCSPEGRCVPCQDTPDCLGDAGGYPARTVCIQGLCVEGDCETSDDCPDERPICGETYRCRGCQGSQECLDAANAQNGWICETLTGRCRQGNCQSPGAACSETQDYICGSDFVCRDCQNDTECRLATGESRSICVSDGDGMQCIVGCMPTALCTGGESCTTGQICGDDYRWRSCDNDLECATASGNLNKICSEEGGLCTTGCSEGAGCGDYDVCTASHRCGDCAENSQCQNAYGPGFLCIQGMCQEAECNSEKPCMLGKVCDNVVYVCRSCRNHSECGAGRVCDLQSFGGTGRCYAGECTQTTQDNLCDSNLCVDNACKACVTDQECGSGRNCNEATGVCHLGECLSDLDCEQRPGVADARCAEGHCLVDQCQENYRNCDENGDNGCEIDILENVNHCGACSNSCISKPNVIDAHCESGECAVDQCDATHDDCNNWGQDGCETDLQQSTGNCGVCGNDCEQKDHVAEAHCAMSTCVVDDCLGRWDDCDGNGQTGCETDLLTDANHCGVCGTICLDKPHVQAAHCDDGGCMIDGCVSPYDDCNGGWDNGCETDISLNVSHCGECGRNCLESPYVETAHCDSNECVVDSCEGEHVDCNGSGEDGCEIYPYSNLACTTAIPMAQYGSEPGDYEICGDGGNGGPQEYTYSITGIGEKWVKVRVLECIQQFGNIENTDVTFRLDVPPGVDYDLDVWTELTTGAVCSWPEGSSTEGGMGEDELFSGFAVENPGDQTTWYWVKIVYIDADPPEAICTPWSIWARGNEYISE